MVQKHLDSSAARTRRVDDCQNWQCALLNEAIDSSGVAPTIRRTRTLVSAARMPFPDVSPDAVFQPVQGLRVRRPRRKERTVNVERC